jgi:hypothetical protein
MHRSRSTSLLDVETVEKTNSSSDNEGIFPPNVQHSEHNSQEFEHNDNNTLSLEELVFSTVSTSSKLVDLDLCIVW